MTNLRSLFGAMILTIALFLTSCTVDPIVDQSNGETQTSLQFNGLQHLTYGEATLALETLGGEEQLSVSNMGETGLDGLHIDLPKDQNLDLMFEDLELQPESVFDLFATNQSASKKYSGIGLQNNGTETYLKAYVDHGEAFEVRAYRKGELVYRKEYEAVVGKTAGFPWKIVGRIVWELVKPDDAHISYKSGEGVSAGITWTATDNNGNSHGSGSKVDIKFEGSEAYMEVDDIRVVSKGHAGGLDGRLAGSIYGKNLEAFTIFKEILTPFSTGGTTDPTNPVDLNDPTDPVVDPITDTLPPTLQTFRPWILDFGRTSSFTKCDGLGFCNSTFPDQYPIDFPSLKENQALVTNGYLEGDEMHIEMKGKYLSEEDLEFVKEKGLYENPQPFALPDEFVETIFKNANVKYDGETVVIEEGVHEANVTPKIDAMGQVYGWVITIYIETDNLRIWVVIVF